VWEEGVVHMLEEERGGVEGVEGDAVGSVDLWLVLSIHVFGDPLTVLNVVSKDYVQFHQIQLLLLRQYIFNVWL